MNSVTLKRLAGSEADAHGGGLLAFLHHTEAALIRMICGIWLFVWETTPDLIRRVFSWLQKTLELAIRVAVRLLRVTALGFAWMAIVWGPMALRPGLISLLWAALAIAGSTYGLRGRLKRRERHRAVETFQRIALHV